MQLTDPVVLLQRLIQCRSVTPDEGGALAFVQSCAQTLGFSVERPVFHDHDTPDIENLYAKCGAGGPHLMFAGHTDVVPAGDAAKWSHAPFGGDLANGVVYGRGAVDMKGGIACFLAALARILEQKTINGSLSLLITGDEEGPAINGSVKLLQWAADRGETWDAALVGEPTCTQTVGDTVKIGRRGSLSGLLTVHGRQGHVAYPHLADNPLPGLISLLAALIETPLDHGSSNFQASNLELTGINCANTASNVIPAEVQACFNIRFNDLWSPETLQAEMGQRLAQAAATAATSRQGRAALDYTLSWQPQPGAAFVTAHEPLIAAISQAIESCTGKKPQLSTSGGTSDARFIKDYCPVVEFGLMGQTMHKTDECVAVNDLERLTTIYQHFLERYFGL